MKTRAVGVWLIFSLAAVRPVNAQAGASLTTSIKEAAHAFVAAGSGQVVAVLGFPGLDGRTTLLSAFISEQLSVDLATALAGKGSVVERSQVIQVLQEERLASVGLTARDAARVGKKLGATLVLVGTITPLGSLIVVNSRLVSTERAEMVQAYRIEGSAPIELLRLDAQATGGRSDVPVSTSSPGSTPAGSASPSPVEACASARTGNISFTNASPRSGALVRVYYAATTGDPFGRSVQLTVDRGQTQQVLEFPAGPHGYKVTDLSESVVLAQGQVMVEQCKTKSVTFR